MRQSWNSYHMIAYLEPDPLSGARYPVAALVTTGSVIQVFIPSNVPSDEQLGGTGRSRFFRQLQSRLLKANGFDLIPGLGPYCVLSNPGRIDDDVTIEHIKRIVEGWYSVP